MPITLTVSDETFARVKDYLRADTEFRVLDDCPHCGGRLHAYDGTECPPKYCTCGEQYATAEPLIIDGVVHRSDGPCYHDPGAE